MGSPALRIYVDHQLVRELPLLGAVRLGRAADNDVVLDDQSVSAHHGRIERDAGGWRYLDLGSSNGSAVAAGPILYRGETVPLDELTQIRLGATVLEFEPGDGVAPPGPGSAVGAGTLAAGGQVEPPTEARTARAAPDPLADLHVQAPRLRARPRSATTTSVGAPSVEPASEERSPGTPRRTPGHVSRVTQTVADRSGQRAAARGPDREFPEPATRGSDHGLDDTSVYDDRAPEVAGAAAAPPAVDPATLRPRLVAVIDGQAHTLPLPLPRALIGRAPGCDVVLDHPSVSQRHAELAFRDGHFVLRDLSSTNGTRVGLARIDQPTPLTNGSHLIVGAVDLLFAHDGALPNDGLQLDPQAFLGWLRDRHLLSRAQAARALAAARSSGRSVEEMLVEQGVVTPGALTELRHNAGRRLLGLSDEQRGPLPTVLLWMVLTAIVVSAVAMALSR